MQCMMASRRMKSIALAAYPEADETQIDLRRGNRDGDPAGPDRSVRNLRAELKVEPKMKVTIEIFRHDPRHANVIQGNREAVERLGRRAKHHRGEESQARQAAGARSTSRFDVHVIYEKKIDVAAERERLTKELEKIEKQQTNGQAADLAMSSF